MRQKEKFQTTVAAVYDRRNFGVQTLFCSVLAAVALVATGCDTLYGVHREATVARLPDMQALKAKLESYPEIQEVKFREEHPDAKVITLTGLKPSHEAVYYFIYSGGEHVLGVLQFNTKDKKTVRYYQNCAQLGEPPPQAMIDATWPVMKNIEKDLIENFGLSEIPKTLRVDFVGVKNPDKESKRK